MSLSSLLCTDNQCKYTAIMWIYWLCYYLQWNYKWITQLQNKSYDVPHSLPFHGNRTDVVVIQENYIFFKMQIAHALFYKYNRTCKIIVRMQPRCEYMHCVMILNETVCCKYTVATENKISTSFVRSIQQRSCCCYTWTIQTSITELHTIKFTNKTKTCKIIANMQPCCE